MNRHIASIASDGLHVFPKHGVAWVPVHAHTQKTDYFDEYAAMDASCIAEELLEFRRALLRKYVGDDLPCVLDVGIGSGIFIGGYSRGCGYDVDPKAIVWMQTHSVEYVDPTRPGALDGVDAVTFWDSLEHLRYPENILDNITGQHVFVSIPVFKNLEYALRGSKHFKVNEHYLYFTQLGLGKFFDAHGFRQLEISNRETEIGREGIATAVYRRKEFCE